jgi:hypothetical protein
LRALGKQPREKDSLVIHNLKGSDQAHVECISGGQDFTKTSHCWGIENNKAGTNTNRIVVFQK